MCTSIHLARIITNGSPQSDVQTRPDEMTKGPSPDELPSGFSTSHFIFSEEEERQTHTALSHRDTDRELSGEPERDGGAVRACASWSSLQFVGCGDSSLARQGSKPRGSLFPGSVEVGGVENRVLMCWWSSKVGVLVESRRWLGQGSVVMIEEVWRDWLWGDWWWRSVSGWSF